MNLSQQRQRALFFPKKDRPYYIYAPSYTHTSSGVKTLHLLCHVLNEAGCNAKLLACQEPYYIDPNLNTPVEVGGQYADPIVVYPDIVRGNPMHVRSVVRYLLAPAGAYGGDKIFPDTDMIWGALPSLAENVLRIPVCDPDVFYLNTGVERKGSCFYSNKYEMHGGKLLEMPPDCERVCGTPEQVADILRRKEVCYLYELSSVITEAALCGCPVTLIRTPYFNTIDPACMMGAVKWSDGVIVKECDDYYPEYMEKYANSFRLHLLNFIIKTQAM